MPIPMASGGKFAVTDVFDTNAYAHDARGDFLNWGIVDAGAFDYAADAWGYSYGLAAEWSVDAWTVRGGLFDLSRVPNTTELQTDFSQFEVVGELERRGALWGHGGKIKLLSGMQPAEEFSTLVHEIAHEMLHRGDRRT